MDQTRGEAMRRWGPVLLLGLLGWGLIGLLVWLVL